MNITADFVRLNSKFVYALSRVETKILTPTLNLNCLMVEEFACTFANYFYGGIDIISYQCLNSCDSCIEKKGEREERSNASISFSFFFIFQVEIECNQHRL